jgi:hypothetical protein
MAEKGVKKEEKDKTGVKKKFTKKQEKERSEALMRILIGIVSGIIFYIWAYVILLFIIVNLIYTLIKGQRSKEISELCEIFNTQIYVFWRYITFVSNERPFPFESLTENFSEFS